MKNNDITVVGTVVIKPYMAHIEVKTFYSFILSSVRLSGTVDLLNVFCDASILPDNLTIGDRVSIKGQIRERSFPQGEKCHKEIYIFPESVILDNISNDLCECDLQGYICKCSGLRSTPNGRNITDFVIAINRHGKRSYYLPCIAWGYNAYLTSTLSIGSKLHISGRLQSRDYTKDVGNTTIIKTVHEVSVSNVYNLSIN